MNRNQIITLILCCTSFLNVFGQQNLIRDEQSKKDFSGLYFGTIHTMFFCATDEEESEIFIDLTNSYVHLYIDGIQRYDIHLVGDTLLFGDEPLGYFDSQDNTPIFLYNSSLKGMTYYYEDSDDEPLYFAWAKIKNLEEVSNYIELRNKKDNAMDSLWRVFLLAYHQKNMDVLKSLIGSEMSRYDYDIEDNVIEIKTVEYAIQTLDDNYETLTDGKPKPAADLDSDSAINVYISVFGYPRYFGDNDACFPGSYILYNVPTSIFFKEVNGKMVLYYIQYL